MTGVRACSCVKFSNLSCKKDFLAFSEELEQQLSANGCGPVSIGDG